MRRFLIAGNWKMNTNSESAKSLASDVAAGAGNHTEKVCVLLCPPFPYLALAKEAVNGTDVKIGAQDVYFESPGAFTGEVSVDMLSDVGCFATIIGHSERRHVLGEDDVTINKKVKAALAGGLGAVLCVGELLEERDAGNTETVLDTQMAGGLVDITSEQMEKIVIAYEPVWAIGTGKVATPDQAESVHAHLRNWLESRYNSDVAESTRILYGGSVKANNARTLLEQQNVDGALVGGASLKADSFVPIIEAAADLSTS